ncbi:hypothetical protein R0131_17470 [Clostridium sp. AL.422]|uniref:hypothetical protein n=1 Tax=Clostridium TaxID=1485 RepID=UPI00293DB439|nr:MULTISPECIES: hypothetical protein [unclassified Clostridium]MDV4152620.1 hypothetical protein [Clostridium sp. AL.422]
MKFRISKVIFLCLIISIFLNGCLTYQKSTNKRDYNLIVINNSKEDIKSYAYKTNNSSGGANYANNSFIKKGDKFHFLIDGNKFQLSIIDKNNNTISSQEFNADFNNKNKVYVISIDKNEDGDWSFKFTK